MIRATNTSGRRKLRLINPTSPLSTITMPEIIQKMTFSRRALFMPLNLAICAAVAPDGWDVEIVDENVLDAPHTPEADGVDAVGIGAMTTQASRAYQLADAYRALGVPVILGGIHASALPQEALEHGTIVCKGDAESTLPRALEDLAAGAPKSVYDWRDAPDTPIATPRKDLLNAKDYLVFNPIQTTRGCPHGCTFCTTPAIFGRKFRRRDVGDIVEEIRAAKEAFGTKTFIFSDDDVAGDHKWAMDLFDAGDSKEELAASIGRAEARWLVMSFSSDWLFPPDQSRQIVEALLAARRAVTYCQIASHCGHDAFLLPNEIDTYGELLRAFLANVNGAAVPGVPEAEAGGPSAISIFHPDRTDYDRIAELIPAGASVLDLGCGAGQLLTLLRERGHEKLMGVELDERSVLACARRGLDVIHADLNAGLPQFGEGQFDCVILSQTLQAVLDVPGVLESMLRVGGRCIVSFPNFAYRTLRRMLAEEGRAPEAPGILSHHWYDTPNVRFLSIKDFEQFCQERGYRVHRRVCLDTEAGEEVHEEPNLNADLAIYVISR